VLLWEGECETHEKKEKPYKKVLKRAKALSKKEVKLKKNRFSKIGKALDRKLKDKWIS